MGANPMFLGRLIRSEQSGSSVGALRTQHQYDAQNRLSSQSWQLPGHEFWEVFAYNNQNGTMSSMEMGSGESVNYAYDSLLRLESVTLEDVYEHRRNYMDGDLSGQQTSQIQYFNYYDPDGTTLKYGYRYLYDNGGKIQEVYYRENNEPLALENTFEYDKLGQLTSATGAFGNETYTYDTAGNLLTRTSGATSAQYTYDNPSWGDLLTAYQGQRIAYEGQSYDAENNTVTGTVVSGNPVSYYNGDRWDMEWIRGRLLFQATSDDISVTYTYDKNNLRSSKTINGVEYSYTYAGDKLMRQSWAGNELYFFYDASGNPTALWYEPENGSTVVGYYMLDQQGNVVRMEDANGNVLASYSYDPWGKIISATGSLAEINPLRYRGYVYDQETGFYYLQSRYYDPAISRFLNADGYAVTGEGGVLGYNMFAYCNNDPVNKSDTDGSRPVEVDEDPNRRLVATIKPRAPKKTIEESPSSSSKTEYGATIAFGKSLSVNTGIWSFDLQAGLAIDMEGNVAVQVSFFGAISSGGSLSLSKLDYFSVTNAKSVYELSGTSYQGGGSVSVPIPIAPPLCVTGAGDILTFPAPNGNDSYWGGTLAAGVGIGAGAEFHVGWGETTNLFVFNIWDILNSIVG